MQVIFTLIILAGIIFFLAGIIFLCKEYEKVEKVKVAINNLNSHITETIIYLCTRQSNGATNCKLNEQEKVWIKDWFNKIKFQQEELYFPNIVSKDMKELEKVVEDFFNEYFE